MVMSGRLSTARERARERRGRRRRRVLLSAAAVVVLAAVFFAGLSLGRALEEGPGADEQTFVRTLVPTTLIPPRTVTVTVSKP
jgi:hypothetical protein